METILRLICKCSQNDLRKAGTAGARARNRKSAQSFLLRFQLIIDIAALICRRKKRYPAIVHQPVKNKPQRIYVRCVPVPSSEVHFRSHVVDGTDPGPCRRMIHHARYAKIPQFIISSRGYHNIRRLDIPVNDSLPLADREDAAHIKAQADHFIFIKYPKLFIFAHRGEQFHSDKDPGADPVRVHHDRYVFTAHNVDAVFHPRHHRILAENCVAAVLIPFLQTVRIIPVIQVIPDLSGIPRNRNDLHGRPLVNIQQMPADLIYFSVASVSDFTDDRPARERHFHIFCIHGILSAFLHFPERSTSKIRFRSVLSGISRQSCSVRFTPLHFSC